MDDRALDSDGALRDEVLRELALDPEVDETHIAVSVENGAVTLGGHVSSYPEKHAAVRAAERVFGVRAVADELKVELHEAGLRDDIDIAEAIAQELRWNALVPDTVKAEVRRGVVTLRGVVDFPFQREEAERLVENVTGITGVSNEIVVRPPARPDAGEIRKQVIDALDRLAAHDANHVTVQTGNATVVLRGRVHSIFEREVAEEVARSASGSAEVVNEIAVEP
jgi:osmotically-inducible protein OsmY